MGGKRDPELSGTLLAQMELMDRNFDKRMDQQDGRLDELLVHAKITNGRITRLEEANIAEGAVEAERQRRDDADLNGKRFFLSTVVAIGTSGAVIITALLTHTVHF